MPRCIYESPIGTLYLESDGAALTGCGFSGAPGGDRDAVLAETCRQLDEYFQGRRRQFDLPLAPAGTAFQKAVWKALEAIPYGQTICYRQLAVMVGKPGASRAVGGANHRNPIPVILPCHRVIGADGSLTGYAGGLEAKAFLLALESRFGK